MRLGLNSPLGLINRIIFTTDKYVRDCTANCQKGIEKIEDCD